MASRRSPMTRRQLFSNALQRGLKHLGDAVARHQPAAQPPPRPAPRQSADPTPPPGTEEDGNQMKLPDLHQSFLDPQTLANLFRDIRVCTTVVEVIPKYAAKRMVSETSISLDEGQRLLNSGEARAVQIRYVYEGAQWWDTLINTPSGVQVVRIRHDFDNTPHREGDAQ